MTEDETPRTNIRVDVNRSPEVEAIRAEKAAVEKELEENKAVLAQQALEEFDKLKQRLSLKFSDSNILDCGSPSEVYSYIASINTEKPTEHKSAPAGKSPFYAPSNGHGNTTELIDNLYDTAYYNPKATKDEREEARSKIDKLFTSLKNSPSWRTLKESGVSGLGHVIPHLACRSCGATIQGYPCKKCSFEPKGHEPYTFKTPADADASGTPPR